MFMTALCVPALNTVEKNRKQCTTGHDLQGEAKGGGAPDTTNESNASTQSLIWKGQRGISYMLRYKWCFVRRLLTKTTVPFWCETGRDQNTAKPVGHPDSHQ